MAAAMSTWLHSFREVVIKLPKGMAPAAGEAPGDDQDERKNDPVKRIYKKKQKIADLSKKSCIWKGVKPSEFGRYQLDERFNVDQVPFNLENGARKLFMESRGGIAQISGQAAGEKRFGTLQVCIHGGTSEQPPLTMIFRGKGCVPGAGKGSYHPKVRVLFQDCAWADKKVVSDWMKDIFGPWLKEKFGDNQKEFLLLQDNLGCQRGAEYIRTLHSLGGVSAFGPANKTEGWQPIDAGHIGATLKNLAKVEFELWLEQPCGKSGAGVETYNWQRWEDNKLSMREKRVLMTWIFGKAWEQLISKKYLGLRQSAFRKTGMHVTLSGINDDWVTVEGKPDFAPLPPGAPWAENHRRGMCKCTGARG